MECYKCNRKPIEHNLNMIAVDPKGSKERRWVCTECADKTEKKSVDSDIVRLCTIINPSFKAEVSE